MRRHLLSRGMLSQRLHDHRPGYRCGWSGEQGRQAPLDPCEYASVGVLGTHVVVEDADSRRQVFWCMGHATGSESRSIAEDRDRPLLDSVRALLPCWPLLGPDEWLRTVSTPMTSGPTV
jgi:hypothetical protein